jgi:uncharacterized protein YkwD
MAKQKRTAPKRLPRIIKHAAPLFAPSKPVAKRSATPAKPKKTAARRSSARSPKRGRGFPPIMHFAKVMPLLLILLSGLWLSAGTALAHGRSSVLAYATSMSVNDLLTSTNQQRVSNGVAGLGLNSKLNAAAQAKANDMVARDYWSHVTPDGQQPWVFFQNAGYEYNKAGENLAYGFDNASWTVNGWMNSPGHRANLLDPVFKEVGFGFANSPNFVGTGEETIIVAMYGAPYGAIPVPAPTTPPAAKQASPSPQTPAPQPAPAPAPAAVPDTPAEVPAAETQPDFAPSPETERLNTAPAGKTPRLTVGLPKVESQNVSRLQSIFIGSMALSSSMLAAAGVGVVLLWLMHHATRLKRFVLAGERAIVHHPLLDVTVLAFGALILLATQSSGVIR